MKTYRVIERKTGYSMWWCKNGFDDTPHTDFYLEDARRMFGMRGKYRIEEWEDGNLANPDVDPASQEDIQEFVEHEEFSARMDKETEGMDVFEAMQHRANAIWMNWYRKKYLEIART